MKSIRQIYSLLFWGIALIVITLFNSCGPHVGPDRQTLFVYGDSLKKVTISYYDLGNKTETVTLPFYTMVSKEHDAPSSDKFYLTACDTSLTYRGFIGNFVVGDSCDAMGILDANFKWGGTPNPPQGCKKMSNDSLLNYAKKIAYPGYFEMKKGSTSGCQTVTPY
jgi:hypothetical protein